MIMLLFFLLLYITGITFCYNTRLLNLVGVIFSLCYLLPTATVFIVYFDRICWHCGGFAQLFLLTEAAGAGCSPTAILTMVVLGYISCIGPEISKRNMDIHP